jgi:rhomboid protease GluP
MTTGETGAGQPPAGTGTLVPRRRSALVIALIVANAAIYLATALPSGIGGVLNGADPASLLRWGGASAWTVFGLHQFWRTLTYQFLHGSLLHIGFNMYALAVLAPLAELLYGKARTFFLYVSSGVGAGLVAAGVRYLLFLRHGSASPDMAALESLVSPTVGASGALTGLMGAMLATTLKRDTRTTPALRRAVLGWLASVFIFGFLVHADNLAHLGGLVTGFGVALLLAERWRPQRTSPLLWRVVSVALVVACVGAFVVELTLPAAQAMGEG